MAAPGYTPTLQEVQCTQMTRLDIVLLLAEPNLAHVIESCFVRVLLEIENGNEDYRIFTIRDIGHGQVYHGFSSDQSASTDIYIDLNLPHDLRGINGTSFQLNSVSNSRITQHEYEVWLHSPGPLAGDTSTRLHQRIHRLNTHPLLTARRHAPNGPASLVQVNLNPQQHAAVAPLPSHAAHHQGSSTLVTGAGLAATYHAGPSGNDNGGRRALGQTTAGASSPPPANRAAMPDVLTAEAATRAVMEELRDQWAVFVNPDFPGHKTALLRTAERDLADYLEKLREKINMMRHTCVVCMDRPPTVVTLPCKHKVLCRLCASQVSNCPCCRETAVEVFEPVEP